MIIWIYYSMLISNLQPWENHTFINCAADRRINGFLKRYFDGIGEEIVNIPTGTFVLDRAGLARHMSLPPDKNEYINDYVSSYRIKQGVLHNPKHDRRTTIL
jgi:hypothetical protein